MNAVGELSLSGHGCADKSADSTAYGVVEFDNNQHAGLARRETRPLKKFLRRPRSLRLTT